MVVEVTNAAEMVKDVGDEAVAVEAMAFFLGG